MKRTAERVLGIIGSIMMGIGFILFTLTTFVISSPEGQAQLEEMLQDPEINPTGADMGVDELVNFFVSNGWMIVMALLVSVILGILATVFVKKMPIVSGIMWVLAAIISLIAIWYLIFIPAILFFIAGILAFVRKPKEESTIVY